MSEKESKVWERSYKIVSVIIYYIGEEGVKWSTNVQMIH